MNFGLFALLDLNYKKAEKYHRKSIKIMKILPKEKRIIGATINLARIFICQDKNILAERKLKNILSLAKKTGDFVSLIVIHITFSIIEIKKENFKQAKNRIKKSLKISKSIQRFTEKGTAYYYLALTYLKNKEFADARLCFEKSLQLNFLRKYDYLTVSSLKNLAQIHMFQLNFETTLRYWLLAKLFEKNASGINDATYYHAFIDTKILWQKLGVYRYQQICQAIRGLKFPAHITQLLNELPSVIE